MYYVETEVNTGIGKRLLVYNFCKCKWQVKMTNACVTKDLNLAEKIRSTMLNKNTKIILLH